MPHSVQTNTSAHVASDVTAELGTERGPVSAPALKPITWDKQGFMVD